MTHTLSRRDMLQLTAAGIGGLLLPDWQRGALHAAEEAAGTNWAGNQKFSAVRLGRPETIEEAQQLVRSGNSVHAVGGRHSFSSIADTKGLMLDLGGFNRISVDKRESTVTVGGGVKYAELCPALLKEGCAVTNLASLPHIRVVGAISTATHGSGTGNLAAQVVGIRLINGKGEVVTLTKRDEDFAGAVVGLGATGILLEVTLSVVPEFQVRQWVWEDMPIEQYLSNFGDIVSAGYSVSGFTNWQGDAVSEVWVKRLASDGDWNPGPKWFGATPAPRDRHPIVSMDPASCTAQMGVPGPSWERLPHFRPNHPPSSKGAERHSEYFVDKRSAVAAIRALYAVGHELAKALQISEIRTVRPDELWMSTAYRRDSVAFHCTWTDNDGDVAAAMPVIEAALKPFSPRAHWGKMHTLSPAEVAAQFPRVADFRKLCEKHDPEGKFRNEYLNRYVFGA